MANHILSENGGNYMIKKKQYDGVIVAAHYSPQGDIRWVRAFERHGFVFSDRMVMDRETLVERLRDGRRFKTGERITYLGSDFKVGEDVRLIEKDDKNVIVVGDVSSNHDSLGNLPII
jgi:hypothetical protein